MPHPRRRPAALAAATLTVAALLTGAPGAAEAAPTPAPSPRSQSAAAALAREAGVSAAVAERRVAAEPALSRTSARVAAGLSPTFSAGTWLDARSGTVRAAVTSRAAAAQARSLGASPVMVRWSGRQLAGVATALDGYAEREGAGQVLSWGVEPRSNAVRVRVRSGADDAATRGFLARAEGYGSKVSVVTTPARMTTTADLLGGQQIEFSGYVCSVGFNARTSGGAPVMLTAGHCAEGYPTFTSGGTTIGTATAYSFPGNDYGRSPVSSAWTPRGLVSTWDGGAVAVRGATPAAVGSTICKSGRTTGWTCGTIQATNQTVNYGNADGSTSTVSGLTETSACTEGGDSGGANMSGTQAQGLTSGGAGYGASRVCGEKVGQPNVSYIQPVGEALSAYGLSLVTE